MSEMSLVIRYTCAKWVETTPYISTNIEWNENIFGSNSAKISCQITVNSEGF